MSTILPPPNLIQQVENNDEIDLNKLFFRLWDHRKFIVTFIFIATLIVVGISALNFLNTSFVTNYAINVRFNFLTANQDSYPSGQKFSKNDLITSEMLRRVYHVNEIEKLDVAFENFHSSFNIAPYSINSNFIQRKYEKLLSNKKLTVVEIDTLEKEYNSDLKANQTNFARISFVDNLSLGLSPTLIEKILNDVPKVWSEISIQYLGVLNFKINGKQFYQSDLIDKFEYLKAVRYMLESGKRFNIILEALQKDNLGGYIRDPDTDLVVSDILTRLQHITEFDLIPIESVISNLGLVKNKDKAMLYLSNQIDLLKLKISELKEKSLIYKKAIQLYSENSKPVESSSFNTDSGNERVQYGDGFLTKIVSMVEEHKDIQYRQFLLSNQIELSIKSQELITKLEKNEHTLNILKSNSNELPNTSFKNDYAIKIKNINLNLTHLISSYQRILEIRNQHQLGKNAELYEVVSSQVFKTSDKKNRFISLIQQIIASFFVAFMLSIIIVLLRKAKTK